jgi:hypothetical protein
MNLIKKQLPLLLGISVGLIVLAEFYVPRHELHDVREYLLDFGSILASAAFVLGAINLFQVNWPKIHRREPDWGYKAVLLASATATFLCGIPWQRLYGAPPGGVEVSAAHLAGPARLVIDAARHDAVAKIDGGKDKPVWQDGQPLAVELAPGKHNVKVSLPLPVTGYGELDEDFTLRPGEIATAHAKLPLLWGVDGRLRTWAFNYIFTPCNATMFALLAFFIASAAFRAFRARNTEASLLLGAAILVLLGRAPIGHLIHHSLPDITNWMIDFPNNAGRRAIIMGTALGGIVTGLRVILGLERSHLGSE